MQGYFRFHKHLSTKNISLFFIFLLASVLLSAVELRGICRMVLVISNATAQLSVSLTKHWGNGSNLAYKSIQLQLN